MNFKKIGKALLSVATLYLANREKVDPLIKKAARKVRKQKKGN